MFVAVTALVWAGSSCSSDETTVTSAEPDTKQDASSEQPQQPSAEKQDAAADVTEARGEDVQAAEVELDHSKDLRGKCSISSAYADDHACLPAPKAGEGIQIHIGPSNYDDPEEVAKYIMHPGEESSECFTMRTPNTEDVTYQTFALSGRAGTHHMINTLYEGELETGSFGPCGGRNSDTAKAAGSLPGASKAFMPRSKVAPEYKHVGQVLKAEVLLAADMHYFNFTDQDILREVWLNLYFPTPDTEVTEFSNVIRGFGGLGWNREPIQPGTDQVYKYECPIKGNGNILSLLGHYHAHGKQFTASIKRKGSEQGDKVFEMFDYLEPATFDYNTVTSNPAFGPNTSGAVSGILEVKDGDILMWDCHIINDGMVPLRYVNEVKTGEMCNVWGYSIGTEPIVCDHP
jgi:hypothetical protein